MHRKTRTDAALEVAVYVASKFSPSTCEYPHPTHRIVRSRIVLSSLYFRAGTNFDFTTVAPGGAGTHVHVLLAIFPPMYTYAARHSSASGVCRQS